MNGLNCQVIMHFFIKMGMRFFSVYDPTMMGYGADMLLFSVINPDDDKFGIIDAVQVQNVIQRDNGQREILT